MLSNCNYKVGQLCKPTSTSWENFGQSTLFFYILHFCYFRSSTIGFLSTPIENPVKVAQEPFCLKSWKFVYLWDGSAKQSQNFGISWHLALLIFGFLMFSLPIGKYATTTKADCSKGIHCTKYKMIRPGTRNKLFLVAFLRRQNLHMGQKDQDGYYAENCHFLSSISELAPTDLDPWLLTPWGAS